MKLIRNHKSFQSLPINMYVDKILLLSSDLHRLHQFNKFLSREDEI